MKKVLIALLSILLLTGCSLEVEDDYSEYLYEVIGAEEINKIAENIPEQIQYFVEEYEDGIVITDEETIIDIVNLFTDVKIYDEVECPDEYYREIHFYWGNNYYAFSFVGDSILLADGDNQAYYQVTNQRPLIDYLNEQYVSAFENAEEFTEVLNYSNVVVELGNCIVDDDNNLILDFHAVNNSKKNYSFKVDDVEINGFPLNTYRTCVIPANNELSFVIDVPTSGIFSYGIDDFGTITLTANLYEYSTTTGKVGKLAATSDVLSIGNEESEDMDTEANLDYIVYNKNDIIVCQEPIADEFFTYLNMLVVNNSSKDITLSLDELSYDKEVLDITGAKGDYTFTVAANSNKFAYLPLSTFDYDETKDEAVAYTVDVIELVWTITSGSKKDSFGVVIE